MLHGGIERNRSGWQGVSVPGARMREVWGWQFSLNRREHGEAYDHWFLHVEPGYFIELLRERPDAVITFEMGFRTLSALAYGAFLGKPVWVWWGGTVHTERNVGRFRRLMRWVVASRAKHWISYGQTSTEYLLALGISRARILQIQNCVDESWYELSKAPLLDVQPKPVLLHVGQMIARKGVDRLLIAAAQLQSEGVKFSLLLVGGGRDEGELRRLATELRLENIHFYPGQPPHAMPAIYRSADVLVFPTNEDVWGLVANEAVLSGLPVLCSRYAGCAPELFDPECIFDPADEKEFMLALRRAVEGGLPCPDRSRLKSSFEVGSLIARAIEERVGVKTDRQATAMSR
jgi:glycosyltransferase involved in cell wall biosynthesis